MKIDRQIERGLSFSSVAAAKQVRPQNLEEYEVDAQTESCLSEKFFPQESPGRPLAEAVHEEVVDLVPKEGPDGPVTVVEGHTEGAVEEVDEHHSWAEEEA